MRSIIAMDVLRCNHQLSIFWRSKRTRIINLAMFVAFDHVNTNIFHFIGQSCRVFMLHVFGIHVMCPMVGVSLQANYILFGVLYRNIACLSIQFKLIRIKLTKLISILLKQICIQRLTHIAAGVNAIMIRFQLDSC